MDDHEGGMSILVNKVLELAFCKVSICLVTQDNEILVGVGVDGSLDPIQWSCFLDNWINGDIWHGLECIQRIVPGFHHDDLNADALWRERSQECDDFNVIKSAKEWEQDALVVTWSSSANGFNVGCGRDTETTFTKDGNSASGFLEQTFSSDSSPSVRVRCWVQLNWENDEICIGFDGRVGNIGCKLALFCNIQKSHHILLVQLSESSEYVHHWISMDGFR
ncbi:hypothetical protein EDD86DRAFT_216302 [Gorgonomyces haynaldii]|nr:hypothetical protein EDD86DRAFT_216302 [Gorgonomyces haynaldii]